MMEILGQNFLLPDQMTSLLSSREPWVRYRALTDLFDLPLDDPQVTAVRQELLAHPLIRQQVKAAMALFDTSITRHDDVKLPYYSMKLLAEIGLRAEDEGMGELCTRILSHQQDGLFSTRMELPSKDRQAPADETWAAMPCDSPLLTTILLALGCGGDRLNLAIETIRKRWQTPSGWFCHFFFVDGQFKKTGLPCPMAALQSLELFSWLGLSADDPAVRLASDGLMAHRNFGKSLYYFKRGKHFWTLKYPFVWYNGLYLAEIISRFSGLRGHPLWQETKEWLLEQMDATGRFSATSVYLPFKEWDFGQKRMPSSWISLICYRILKRMGDVKQVGN